MSAKTIMVQGTSSDAGKSLIVAGLCRIFADQGKKVFPFKSQNMALNSYITATGDEMSRAQVVQAEAARRLPDTRMNPILLKPVGEAQSHVVIKGRFVANTTAAEYYDYKIKLKPIISEIFKEISDENDVIVIEGAGSPAEINLNEHDIVNMGMAKIADSPVVLVADIDRGGVFAQIYGTIALMNEEDRARIKGVIINKFRGDVSLLQNGVEMIEELTQVPVVGVVPFIPLAIDSEDSIALEYAPTQMQQGKEVDVAILMLDKISNFSDFQSLNVYEDVSVRYVKTVQQIGNPDILIIPGTEAVDQGLHDIKAYQEVINHLHQNGTHVLAINTGMALLGASVISQGEPVGDGLNIVECDFEILESADVIQVHSTENQQGLEGYIAHKTSVKMGANLDTFMMGEDYQDGFMTSDQTIIGTQLNGLFQNLTWTRAYLNQIRLYKGLPALTEPKMSYMEFKNREYDKLAHHLSEHLDMEMLNEIMNQ